MSCQKPQRQEAWVMTHQVAMCRSATAMEYYNIASKIYCGSHCKANKYYGEGVIGQRIDNSTGETEVWKRLRCQKAN